MSDSEGNADSRTSCPTCGGNDLHVQRLTSAAEGGLYLLQGLGGFGHFAHFDVVVCADCGRTQFFAEPSAYEQLPHPNWEPLRNRPNDEE